MYTKEAENSPTSEQNATSVPYLQHYDLQALYSLLSEPMRQMFWGHVLYIFPQRLL